MYDNPIGLIFLHGCGFESRRWSHFLHGRWTHFLHGRGFESRRWTYF